MCLEELIQGYIDTTVNEFQLVSYKSFRIRHLSVKNKGLKRRVKIIKPNEEMFYVSVELDENDKITNLRIDEILSVDEPFALIEEIEKESAERLFEGFFDAEEFYDRFWLKLYEII